MKRRPETDDEDGTMPPIAPDRPAAAEASPEPTASAVAAGATESLVILANRLPVHRIGTDEDGAPTWRTSPGGLVSALTPVLRAVPSTWVGWPGVADEHLAPFEHDGIRNVPVPVAADELETFYEGFANATIWPLYHDAVRPPAYHRRWWRPYEEVNRRFAKAAADAAPHGATVWVHDYHFQLVPAMLRRARPDLRIGFFLHIPFPPPELFAQLPWRRQILDGLLGADVIGFQTRVGAENFRLLAKRFTTAQGLGARMAYDGRLVRADCFPISIDFEHVERSATSPAVAERAAAIRSELGDRRILLGVDRLDYTKGIDVRLKAFGELLESGEATADDVAFVQVAVPSREKVGEYQTLRGDVERLVGELNGRFGRVGRTPVHYLHRGVAFEELLALYRCAHACIVTPFRDGMNLVAKEYCAARVGELGVLVLSEFTGAAKQLDEAILVNPHDVDGLADAMSRALAMDETEQRRRMAAMRASIRRADVFRWSDDFLEALRHAGR